MGVQFIYKAETHEYSVDGRRVPSLTEILNSAGIVDSQWFNDYARDKGTFVHSMTAMWDKGTLDEDTLDPQLFMYLVAWRSFRVENRVFLEFADIERPLFHETLMYGCTPDRVAGDGPPVIIEIKTNKLPWW